MNRLKWALLFAAAVLILGGAAAAGEFQVREIKVGDKTITVMIYQGQSYRRIDFKSLTDAKLTGQLVCIEGKMESSGTGVLRLYGTDHRFLHSVADMFKKYSPGDNVWLGGRLEKSGRELEFKISVAVKLKSDLALFEERFKVASEVGEWRRLIDLAEWISKSKDYNTKIAYDDHRRYRTCKSRAIAKACACAERAFKNENAAGYADLAYELIRLGADQETAFSYLRRAAHLDPELQKATSKLSEAGYVRFRGLWVTKADKAKKEAAEKERLRRRLEEVRDREERRVQDAISGAINYAADAADLEAAVALLKGKGASERLVSSIERAAGPRLARRALLLTAALPAQLQDRPIAVAMRSAEPQVRCAALELAATRKDLAARKVILEAARSDTSAEVTEKGCRLLAAAADADALEALVKLVGSETAFRSRAAIDALRDATDEDRFTEPEWGLWWKRNKASFPAGPTK
ncbi:MAG: hypothetical protein ACYTGB_16090 [Planctomycetota bacterium]